MRYGFIEFEVGHVSLLLCDSFCYLKSGGTFVLLETSSFVQKQEQTNKRAHKVFFFLVLQRFAFLGSANKCSSGCIDFSGISWSSRPAAIQFV